jgi:hypothetical protein
MRGLGRASQPVAHRPWRGNAEAPRLATYLLVRACQQLWLDEHHGPFTALQLVLTSYPAFLAPDRLALLAVAVSARAFTAGLATEATLSHGLQTPLPAVVGNP